MRIGSLLSQARDPDPMRYGCAQTDDDHANDHQARRGDGQGAARAAV